MSEIPPKVLSWGSIVFGRAQSFHDVFPDVVKDDTSLLRILNVDLGRRVQTKPGVAGAPIRGGRFLVAVRSLGEQRHSSSSEVGGLVVASKKGGSPPAWGGG